MSSISREQMKSKISLLILAGVQKATLSYKHITMSISLPKLKDVSHVRSVIRAQLRAEALVEIYYNKKFIDVTREVKK